MFIFRVVLVPDYVETHPSLHLFSRLLSFFRRLHRTDERRCRLSFYCRNAVSESVRSGRWRCMAPGGLAVALLPKADSCGSSGMPSLCGFVPWQRSICSVDDLNGRSYAKFHPSLHFSAVFPLLLERLRRPFGSASDARGRGSFRHGTVGYFPAIVGGRVSRQPLFRGSGPVRSADAQILQHWG